MRLCLKNMQYCKEAQLVLQTSLLYRHCYFQIGFGSQYANMRESFDE